MISPHAWSDEPERYAFFARLPRPVAVMLACDLAALVPQPPVGAEAIAMARRWIMGAAEPRDVRAAARAAAIYARTTSDPAYAAAAAANTVHTSTVYLAYSAAAVSEAVRRCADRLDVNRETVGYEAQQRRVEYLCRALEEESVRLLIMASDANPAARPVLWDAMLDAGYTPQPTRLEAESLDDSPTGGENVPRGFIARLWRNVTRQ